MWSEIFDFFARLEKEGNIEFYKHAGFILASSLNIHYHAEPKASEVPYSLVQELIPGYLDGVEGAYHTPKTYYIAFENPEAFLRRMAGSDLTKRNPGMRGG